jgi:hypothetical protein
LTQAVDSRAALDAGRVYGSVRSASAAAVSELVGLLQGSAGMAGTDDGAHAWANQYDPLAKGLMDASASVVNGAGKCADLLNATAVNHHNADAQSAVNPPGLWPPSAETPIFATPSVPSAEGGHGDVPEWWHTISAYVEGELWPNGHQDKLRAAHDAWQTAARELRSAAQLVNGGTSSMGAIAPLMDQQSPEFPALLKNCTMERDQMTGVADGFDSAAQTCADYAQAIDDAHSKILHEVTVLGATVAVTEIVAAVLIPFTVGVSEGVSKVVDVTRLTATGARIANIIREFRVAAELSGLPAISAAGAAVRTVSEMAALLSARVRIFLSEVSGRAAAEGGAVQAKVDRELSKALADGTIEHVFRDAVGHNFTRILAAYGGDRVAVLREVLVQLQTKVLSAGVFNQIPVTINGDTILVNGRVVDGFIRIGSAWLP